MTKPLEAFLKAHSDEFEDYLTRILSNLASYSAYLNSLAEKDDPEALKDDLRAKDLRDIAGTVAAYLKEEGRLRDDLRKQRDAEGGAGIDLDDARDKVERRMALLREQARSRCDLCRDGGG